MYTSRKKIQQHKNVEPNEFEDTEKYEPVNAKWTSERCTICRWDEDYDLNAIVIHNRCQIAVHQECYGVGDIHDFTSWVCSACETPKIARECCLCPVKGCTMKPTDIDTLWVHVICTWLRPKVAFVIDEKMEPAIGLLRIPPDSFMKCCKCTTYFHAMCASRAGYCVEMHSSKKDRMYNIKWTPYCAVHKIPVGTGIVIKTSSEVFCAKGCLKIDIKNRVLGLQGFYWVQNGNSLAHQYVTAGLIIPIRVSPFRDH